MKNKKLKLGLIILMTTTFLIGCSKENDIETHIGTNSISDETSQTVDSNHTTDAITDTIVPVDSYEPVIDFSYKLFKQGIEDAPINPVLSPVSAYLALSMTGIGADHETRYECNSVLGENMLSLSNDLMTRLPYTSEQVTLNLANSAWLDLEFIPEDEWVSYITDTFNGEFHNVSLPTKKTQKAINHWIDEKTEGLIPTMLDEPLYPDTKLVLFNTVYFKGDWAKPFKEINTRDYDFTTTAGKTITVDMMHQSDKQFDYLKDDTVEGIILPYAEGNLAFVALKPLNNTTARDLYSELTTDQISNLLNDKTEKTINLMLPKFEVSFDKTLNDTLKNMGMKLAFDSSQADLSKLGKTVDGASLYVTLVRQKAVIIVDEKGTEAAAATQVSMESMGAMIETNSIDLYFDQPFIYMLMDMETEVPVFMGIMDDPSIIN